MILNSGDSSTRKTLITLIIAALLVNFSLFITKFIVDFTNILASEIAGAFVSSPIEGSTETGDVQISSAFMQLFGLSGVWDIDPTQNEATAEAGQQTFMYIFGTAIVFMIGAFCFAAGGIMLIIRFAALCIYMVFSPLMFLGMVFPGLQSVSSKYWSGFLGRAFFAPAYLMLIYLAAFVMGSYNESVTGANGFRETFTSSNPESVAQSIGPFFLTSVFLIASVVVASKMSADGASTAISMGKNLSGRAQRGVRNTAMFAPRRVARAGAGASANVARRMDNRLLSSDSRWAKAGRGSLAAVGLDARTRNNMIEGGRNAKMGTKYSSADNAKNKLDQQTRINNAQQERERDETYIGNINAAKNGTTAEIRKNASNKLAGAIAKMSTEELLRLNIDQLQHGATASKLSDTQLKALAESGNYDNAEMKKIKEARDAGTFTETFAALENTEAEVKDLNEALDELGTTVRGLSNDRLQSMDADTIADERVATNLTHTQVESLQSSGKFSTGQIEKIKNNRNAGFEKIASQGSVLDTTKVTAAQSSEFTKKQREKLVGQNAQQTGNLPVAVFKSPDMVQHLTPQALEQRMKNGGVSESDRKAIEGTIQTHIKSSDERVGKMWKKWSNNTTIGSNFSF